jgi:plastocyanin
MARSRRWTALGFPVAILMVLAVMATAIGAPGATAQEGDEPHPAHIHTGTCEELGDIVAPLNDVTLEEGGGVEGAESAIPAQVSETEIELGLADILAAPHAVNVHESQAEIENYISCGDIGGRVVDGRLVIGLQEINGSDHSGVAVLEADDEDETDVRVYLVEEGATAAEEPASGAGDDATAAADDGEATAEADAEETATAEETAEADDAEATIEADETPAADETVEAEAEETVAAVEVTVAPEDDEEEATEAAAAEPAGEEVAVDIIDFSYDPDAVEIAVGDTITWTNQDGVPHTATASERDVLQSGAIASGESFSQTFEEAGEYEYFCEFHPNMLGTIVVE